jgi:hypothetical protein
MVETGRVSNVELSMVWFGGPETEVKRSSHPHHFPLTRLPVFPFFSPNLSAAYILKYILHMYMQYVRVHTLSCGWLVIIVPVFYMAQYVMVLRRARSITRGIGRGWDLEIDTILGPKKSRFPGPTHSSAPKRYFSTFFGSDRVSRQKLVTVVLIFNNYLTKLKRLSQESFW